MYQTSQGGCGSSCGYNRSSGSRLEYIANNQPASNYHSSSSGNLNYSIAQEFAPQMTPLLYESGRQSYGLQNLPYDFFKPQREYQFQPDLFLQPGKEGTFVGEASQIREFLVSAFEKLMQQSFPHDIKISVLEEKKFRKLAPHPGTLGLAINRSKLNLLSEIFVLQGSLGRVLLTIGHELGHVLTPTLDSAQDEEAKAYAFSLEWMRIIKENNIANLREAIVFDTPAQNGLHNVAFDFVSKLIKEGKRAWYVYVGLVKNVLSIAEK